MNGNHALDGAAIFIFGATGDLAKRKLYPAIYSLYKEGKLSENFTVIGLARRPRTNEEFRENVHDSIKEFARHDLQGNGAWEKFAQHFHYLSLDITDPSHFTKLRMLTEQLENKFELTGNRLFYLALAPDLFGQVAHHLKDGEMLNVKGWKRLVIEKPFGYDLPSAEKLNEEIRDVFEEHEIFRIDHYLGKEMVQNIEVIRFANAFFEPLWNNKYIANIQITLSETVGVEDRGAYYDQAGALNDMVQNHVLQMVAMMAMELPSRLVPEDIRDEKVKVLRSIRKYKTLDEVKKHVVRGQYGEGSLNGKDLSAYRNENNVDPSSTTETFFTAKLFVDNLRWAGVPFYVRTGKRMPAKATEIVVEFKNLPDNVYFTQKTALQPNLIVFRVNPVEGIFIKINGKSPGSEMKIVPVAMDFCQSSQVGINTPEAYERLLYDALRGESTYFTRWDEVSTAWEFIDTIAHAWKEEGDGVVPYKSGSWGPDEASALLAEDGFKWWPLHGQEDDGLDCK
ncbi:glucose-6-phosphate dehydrogenase [Longirhabdus pacifica]|uniref:glucose-6-phosphate dehydrogenase n=1 Tax=Longirhabdus pacifica TaxID=2305227 RepID=UPI0010089C69|nr:glucose-6-phosphate dehydrogenase [Longirhabdus pacifica]